MNNLLDITRADSGYLKIYKRNADIVSMTRLIAESVSEFANKKDVNVRFVSCPSEKTIAIDDEKYERILLNLLSNAIKFTPSGRNIYVKVSMEGDMVSVSVRDEGVGIPKDKQEVIFERFGQVDNNLTRHSEGTGIGLRLVKLLVEALEGKIKLESTEGAGSTFTILLPDKKVEKEATLAPEMNDNRIIETMNIEFSNIYFE